MNGARRAALKAALEAMDPKERRRLARVAERDLREAKERLRRHPGRSGLRGPGPQIDDPIETWMLHRLAQGRIDEAPGEARGGLVVSLSRRYATVRPDAPEADEPELLTLGLPQDLARGQRAQIAVGDHVTFGPREGGRVEVRAVSPRGSALTRPDPSDPLARQVLVANVERVLVMVAARDPEPRVGLIDRLLVGVSQGGARAALIVNKLDRVAPEEREALWALLAPYAELGTPLFPMSVARGEGIEALRAAVTGHACALVGPSGVGKSSLLNALLPEARRRTGEVNATVGRGRHTSTTSLLLPLPGGGWLVDTPGLRAFGLESVHPLEARAFFPDLAEHAAACRYRDCLHVEEGIEDCGVQRAVAEGRLSPARHAAWARVLASLRAGPG